MAKSLEDRIFQAYFRRYGKNAMQPSRDIDWIEYKGKDYAVLSNVSGILAVYRYDEKTDRLKWINPKWFESRAYKDV